VSDLLDRRLLFVTGKGGVGKTTVTAALALLASQQGKRTLVCEVEAKGDIAAAYETEPTKFREREIAPSLFAMTMDTEASLREYLHLQLRVPVVGRIGPVARAFDFVATAAPGVREILTVGKLCWEVRERHYDLVVVDSPPTGHVVGLLAAPNAINDVVKVGVVRQQTDWMIDIMSDPGRTGVCVVTTPEEMPVSEAIDLSGRIGRDTTVDLACVVANRVLPELFGRGEEEVFDAVRLPEPVAALAGALGRPQLAVEEVLEAARLAATIRRNGAIHLERLRAETERRIPVLFLPYLYARSHGLRAVRQLATALADELGY
jgi:anion-transporting  ArsA/GET3 family ATPase